MSTLYQTNPLETKDQEVRPDQIEGVSGARISHTREN